MEKFLLIGVWVSLIVYFFTLEQRIRMLRQHYNLLSINYNAAHELLVAEKNKREEHTKALKRLTDPESIADDMESGARVREMYDANRTTLPREDAGPPAKVYTPTMRAKVPRGNYRRESPKD